MTETHIETVEPATAYDHFIAIFGGLGIGAMGWGVFLALVGMLGIMASESGLIVTEILDSTFLTAPPGIDLTGISISLPIPDGVMQIIRNWVPLLGGFVVALYSYLKLIKTE